MGININIYNALLFNVAWLLCVLGGSLIALPTVFATLCLHFRYIADSYREGILIGQIVLLGLIVDTGLMISGALLPPNGLSLSPPWLISLWIVFATTLNHCLKWFQSHIHWAAVAGAVFGPGSYYAGTRMSDFSLGEPLWQALLIHAVAWALVFPGCLMMAKRYVLREHQTNSC